MSREEFNGILKGVTLAQVFNGIFIIGSLSIGGAFGVAAIRGDITANAVVEQMHHKDTNHRLDSLNLDVKNDISDIKEDVADIWEVLKTLKPDMVRTGSGKATLVTGHKDENGGVSFRPYKQ